MKLKERLYNRCSACDQQTEVKQEEEYGCDECKRPIRREAQGRGLSYLSANVFRNDRSTEDLEFCSWACALKGLKKVKSDYFVTLPYLQYDEKQRGIRARDFFAAIKAFK